MEDTRWKWKARYIFYYYTSKKCILKNNSLFKIRIFILNLYYEYK